jgi:transcriptional regulator with XRE-family HTH domain
MAQGSEDPQKRVGAAIRLARMRRGMQAKDLAELIGVSQEQFSRWETGSRMPGTDQVVKIADALGLDLLGWLSSAGTVFVEGKAGVGVLAATQAAALEAARRSGEAPHPLEDPEWKESAAGLVRMVIDLGMELASLRRRIEGLEGSAHSAAALTCKASAAHGSGH